VTVVARDAYTMRIWNAIYAMAGVCLSVCHKPVFYRNGFSELIELVFDTQATLGLSSTVFKGIRQK